MYAYISGVLAQKKEDFIVVDAGGIGFKIFCQQPMQERIGKLNEHVLVYTYHYVREDINALYGFPSQEEHDMFILLLQVTGIGPKVANSLAGSIPPGDFALAVITGDLSKLTQVKGVGKKGAERIMLELKDKLKGFNYGMEGLDASFLAAGDSDHMNGTVQDEAFSALVVLGYSAGEASKAVRKAYQEGMAIEELIRIALRSVV
jgi:Holliday junction DNA helicase RuvA